MTLTYRGHTYKPSSGSVQSEGKSIQLMYRGHKFEYKPQPMPLSCDLPQEKDRKAVKLIYRGYEVHHMPPAPQPYRKPRAMNWRFEIAAQYAAA